MSYLKLRELWNECEKLDELAFNVFVEGLHEIHTKKWVNQAAKPCVASQAKTDREKWTPAEEDLLHKYCNEASSVAKGVDRFLRQTDSSRTPGACELRVNEMKRKGRW